MKFGPISIDSVDSGGLHTLFRIIARGMVVIYYDVTVGRRQIHQDLACGNCRSNNQVSEASGICQRQEAESVVMFNSMGMYPVWMMRELT